MSDLYTIYNTYNELGMEVPNELVEAFSDMERAAFDPAFNEEDVFI